MTGKAVLEHSDPSYFARSIDMNVTDSNFDKPAMKLVQPGYSPVQVATAVTFVVAIVQV